MNDPQYSELKELAAKGKVIPTEAMLELTKAQINEIWNIQKTTGGFTLVDKSARELYKDV